MTSENWWKTYARRFELCISREVVRELSDSRFPDSVRLPALGMLMGLDVLELSREVVDFAGVLVDQRVMPGPAVQGDALHLAASVVHGVDYLLTWNQKHLANPNKRTHLAVICARYKFNPPQIVTPDLLIIEGNE